MSINTNTNLYDLVCDEDISTERMQMLDNRYRATGLICRILTSVGAVELVSESRAVGGLLSIIIGLILEKQRIHPQLSTCLAACVVGGIFPVLRAWRSFKLDKIIISSAEGFQLALQAASGILALYVIFIGRRLKQLDELRNEARKRRSKKKFL
jgi:hypothetical protein